MRRRVTPLERPVAEDVFTGFSSTLALGLMKQGLQSAIYLSSKRVAVTVARPRRCDQSLFVFLRKYFLDRRGTWNGGVRLAEGASPDFLTCHQLK